MKKQDARTGSRFSYERGDTVETPLGAGTIHTDPDDQGGCKVLLSGKVDERLITATTFQFGGIVRKWNGKAGKGKS